MVFLARPHHRSWLTRLFATTALSAVAAIPGAHANPLGGQVASGGGTIVQAAPNRVVVNQTTEDLVLNWQSFNIAAGEQVQFQQPNAAAIALNRITGGDASTIAGELTANGQVWIVNPNGVFFTKSAVVNVAGLVATTSNITNANFMAGTYAFGRPGAANSAVVNEGSITVRDAGLAAFVAPAVANSGVIAARLGKVALVSGSKFTVDLYGDNLVKIAVDDRTGATLAKAAVDNTGKIMADGGTVLLAVSAAETLVNNAINVGGTIQARTAAMKDGKIVLSGGGGEVALTGTLDASGKGQGETGGTVEVLGKGVDLSGTAKIDVSGDAGGGTALIGGNFHGAGPEPNAATTTIAAGATIAADALASGNGGRVAIWSDSATSFDGSITARGGALGGNGGFVETSSRNQLDVGDGAIVNTGARNGTGGEWLLDPAEITVVAGAMDTSVVNTGGVITTQAGSPGSVSNTTIDAALGTGNVVIDATGDISVGADIIPTTGNNSLGLVSTSGSILLGANIDFSQANAAPSTSGSTGSLYLAAGASIIQTAGTITLAGGMLSMNAATGIGSGTNQAITVAAAPGSVVPVAAATSSGGVTINGGAGTVQVTTVPDATLLGFDFPALTGIQSGGDVSITAANILVSQPIAGTGVTLTASGGITLNYSAGAVVTSTGDGQDYAGAVTLAASATVSDAFSGPIQFEESIDATTAGTQALTVSAGTTGGITLTGDAGKGTALGSVTLSGGAVTIGGSLVTSNGAVDAVAGGAIAVSGPISTGTGAITLAAGGALTTTAAIGGSQAGPVGLSAATISLGAAIDGGSTLTLSPSAASANIGLGGGAGATADAFNLSQAELNEIGADFTGVTISTGTGTIHLDNGGTALSFANPVTLSSASIAVLDSGGGIATAGDALTLAAPVTLSHGTTFDTTSGGTDAGGANVTLTGAVSGSGAGGQALAITAGSGGTISLAGSLGSAVTPLGAVSLSGATLALGSGVNVTLSNAAFSASGATVLQGNATTIATSGGGINFAGAIDGSVAGDQALSLNAGSGTISLAGSVGASTPLGAVALTDATLKLAAGVGIATSDANFSQTGNTILLGATASTSSIGTADGNISFSGTIDGGTAGDQALSLNAGTGTISLSGSLGGATPLGAIALTDATLKVGAGVSITTSAGTVSQTGNTIFLGAAPATIAIATADGNISFGGTIDGGTAGDQALSFNAGTGTITLAGNVGATTALGAVTLTDAALDLGSGITLKTAGGAVTQTGTTVLLGATAATVTIDTTAGAASGANVAFSDTIDGTTLGDEGLTVKAGTAGTITFSNGVGSATPLGAVTLTDAELDLGHNVTLKTSGGAVSETGVTMLLGGATASAVTIDTTSGAATGGSIGFSDTIDGTGAGKQTLTLRGGTGGTITLSKSVGGTVPLGALSLSDAALDLGANVTIRTSGGAVTQTGATVLLGGAGGSAVTLDTTDNAASTGATVSFSAALDGTAAGDESLTITSGTAGNVLFSGTVGGTTALGAITLTDKTLEIGAGVTIRTAGAAVMQTGPTLLLGAAAATATIDTTAGAPAGAAIDLDGTIDANTVGKESLTLLAGTAGTISLPSNIGATKALGALSLTDEALDLGSGVTIRTSGGAVSQTGSTILLGATPGTVLIDTTANGAAAAGANTGFSSTIDGATAGDQALMVTAGTAGTVTLSGNVGNSTALGAISLSDKQLDLGSGVTIRTSGGAVTQSGATVLLGAAPATVLIDTTAGGTVAAGAAIGFGGTIDGGTAGDAALDLMAGTGGTITLSGGAGTTTALGAITLSDAVLDLGSGVTIRTSGGVVSQTGVTVLLGAAPATVLIDTTANGAAPAGASIRFSSTIDGTTAGDEALSLMAGTAGTITLPSSVGATTALGAITLGDAALDLGSGVTIRTSGGAVSQAGTTLLQGATAATVLIDTTANGTATAGANIGFTSTIDGATAGDQALTLLAGTAGTITLSGSVGHTKALGAITLSDGELDLGSGITIRSSGGAVMQTGATVLLGAGAATVTLDTTAAGAAAAGANVAFDGTIDATSAGGDGLSVTAGTAGTITLSGNVGHSVPLGGISLTDAALDLGSGVTIRTSGGAVTQTGVTMLLGALGATAAIDTTAGGATSAAIGFSSTIDDATAGAASLSLTAGNAGTITLSGNVGATTALGAISLSDQALDLASGIALKTKGGAVSEAGSTVLLGASAAIVTIDTSSGAAAGAGISFGAIDDATTGDVGLSLAAGTNGTITLSASIGALHALGAITLADKTLDLGSAVTILTSGGAVSQTGATLLLGGAAASTIAIDTTAGGALAGGAAISFSSTIDGTAAGKEALALTAGTSGGISLTGDSGKATKLGSVTLSGGAVTIGGSLVTSNGAVDAVSGGAIVVSGPISTGTGAITLAAGGALTTSAAIGGSQAGPVSLSAATISLGATVDGGSTLTLSPSAASANIGLGGGAGATADAFNLSQAELNKIGADFTGVTISTGTGTIHLDNGGTALGFANPVTLSSASIAILDSGGGIATAGDALTLAAPVTLSHGTTFDTTSGGTDAGGANITLTGAVSGSGAGGQALAITAGSGGTISLAGSLGSAVTPLGAVSLSGATLAFASGVNVTLSNAGFSASGATVLQGNATTIATSGGGISFHGTIDGTTRGAQALTLDAGSGTIMLLANIGATTAMGALSLSDAALDLGSGIGILTASGAVANSGALVLLGTPGPLTAVTITTTAGATAGANITLAGAIDASDAGIQGLALAAGSGTIALGGDVGAATPLSLLSLTDAKLTLPANFSATLAGGAFTETGATMLAGGAGSTTAIDTTAGGATAAIQFLGTIDGGGGGEALSLAAGGKVVLAGTVGGTTPLGAISLGGTTIEPSAGIAITTDGGAVSVTGATVLEPGLGGAILSITTGGAAISFGGAIDAAAAGSEGLTLDAGAATITLNGNLGGTTPLGAVSLTGGAIDLAAGIGIATAGGAVTATGAVTLADAGATTTIIDTNAAGHGAGASITIAGTIDGGVRGDQALTLAAGTGGTIALSAALGGGTALGAVTLAGATLALGSGAAIVTASGAVSATGAILLQGGGAATIDTTAGGAVAGAAIAIGKIDGAAAGQQALTLDAGSGTIALSGNLGGTTALGAVTLDDALLTLAPGVSIATSGGAITQTGATMLLAGGGHSATTIATTAAGAAAGADINFGGTIDGGTAGQQALTLAAGTGGTIMLGGNLGATTPLGAVTLGGALLQVAAGLSLVTDGGAVSLSGAMVLGGSATIDTTATGNDAAGANITLAGPIDASAAGAQALTLDAGSAGTIALSGTIGGTTPVGAVTLTDAVLDLGGSVTTAGAPVTQTGATVITADAAIATTGAGAGGGDIMFGGAIDGGATFGLSLAAGTGTITLAGTVGHATPLAALTMTDAELDLGANVGLTAATSVGQSGATVLLGGAQATTTTITADSVTFAGTIDGTAGGDQALVLRANGMTGTISLSGMIGSQTPLGAVGLTGAVIDLGATGGIVTAGGAVSLTGETTLLGNGAAPTTLTIDTTASDTVSGANVSFAGDIEGTMPGLQALSINAGSSVISLGSVGSATPLGALSFTDATLKLAANATLSTSGGAITQTGATQLLAGAGATTTLFDTTAGGTAPAGATIAFDGTIDGGAAGQQALSVSAGAGTVTLAGAVGGTTALGAVALDDGSLALAGGASITTAGGAFTQSGSTAVTLAGTGTSITVNTTANAHPAGAAISFGGTIDDLAAGRDALVLNAGTGGTISLAGSVGGTTALGALSFTDAVLALDVDVTLATSGGAVTQPGAIALLGGGSASAVAIDTTAGGTAPAGADITIGGAIDATGAGMQALTLDAGSGGTIALAANIGAHTALGGLTLSNATLDLPANLTVTSAGGAIVFSGATRLAGAGAQSLAIDATAGGTMAAGADITLGALDGGAPGKLALSLNAGTAGTVALTGAVGGTSALASLSLRDGILALGPGGVSLDGTPFTQTGPTVLLGAGGGATLTTIDTTGHGAAAGAVIAFAGPIDGSVAGKQALTLESGTSDITLGGSIGAATPLGALTFTDAQLWLGPNLGITTAGGAVMETGITHLLAVTPVQAGAPLTSVTIDTAGAGFAAGASIGFTGALDGTRSGGEALALNAGSGGTITLGGDVGATTPLGGLSLTGATIDFDGELYQTNAEPIVARGDSVFQQTDVAIVTVMETVLTANTLTGTATTGASITLTEVSGPRTTLTLDPGISFVSVGGGSLTEIVVLEGHGSVISNLVVNETSLGGSGTGNNLVVAGSTGTQAAERAFIRPGGNWTVNGGLAIITDPALLGLSNEVLNNEGIGPAIALMVEIQQLIARGDTGETAAQQAFDQFPNRSNYGVDPFHQRYNILGVAQQSGVAGFEDISYVQDGFWEGLLKK